ncbi:MULTISPECIES: hypothetical protein [unclassified Mesorhizobium]|uniref:hypothetical protein n=1 Tax=unclassified Mesorhizobium TaxID=325217 RepID=UPI00333B7F5B
MSRTDTGMRVAGAWLAIASVLLGFVLVGHGPIHPDLALQMHIIANNVTLWVVVHWAAAAALSLFVVASLIVLTAGSRLTEHWWTLSAWAVVPVGALWTMTTAVAEATTVADAAAANDMARFTAWWAFAEGKANGFMFLCLAVVVIAGNEALSRQQITPTWASLVGVVAGLAAFAGWPLGMWFGIWLGSLVWVASSFVMALWTLWFGLGLARTEISVSTARSSRSST